MATSLKSSTLNMNKTLQTQTQELGVMEELAEKNLDDVSKTAKKVEDRLKKKKGLKKQLAMWSLIGSVLHDHEDLAKEAGGEDAGSIQNGKRRSGGRLEKWEGLFAEDENMYDEEEEMWERARQHQEQHRQKQKRVCENWKREEEMHK